MILVDSTIPMYVVGADHPNKTAAADLLTQAIADGEELVTDAEVLQEILHRYVAIDRREAIGPAMNALLGIVDQVYEITAADVEEAARIVMLGSLSARDALHIAVMRRRGIDRVMTFDKGFDRIPGIRRYRRR